MSLDLSDHRLEPMAMHISRGLTIALILGFSLVALNSQAPQPVRLIAQRRPRCAAIGLIHPRA